MTKISINKSFECFKYGKGFVILNLATESVWTNAQGFWPEFKVLGGKLNFRLKVKQLIEDNPDHKIPWIIDQNLRHDKYVNAVIFGAVFFSSYSNTVQPVIEDYCKLIGNPNHKKEHDEHITKLDELRTKYEKPEKETKQKKSGKSSKTSTNEQIKQLAELMEMNLKLKAELNTLKAAKTTKK